MNPRIVKIGRNILFLLSVPLIIGAFVFAEVSTKDEICNEILISFSNNQLSFVTKENINTILEQRGVKAHKTKLRNLNISELESAIEESKWVNNSNIFVAADHSIHINIDQKVPVLRVQPINDYEEPYYLDSYGNCIPLSMQYTADLPVVTAPEIGFSSRDLALKSDLVVIAKYITKDTFWNAAVTQIDVNANRSISLIPAFGTQQIILGTIDNFENKMSRLFQFYQQGYHTVNWDKYDEIDLRFERQIVCRNTRGQHIAVDPYDKSTHKINAVTAIDYSTTVEVAIADDIPKPKVNSAKANVVIAKQNVVSNNSKSTVKKPSTSSAKPVAAVVKTNVAIEKANTRPDKVVAASNQSISKPEIQKDGSKNDIAMSKSKEVKKEKGKSETIEVKAKATEVKESKYFK